MTELYEILGVEVDATQEEIKVAYRKQSMVHHPDKGGDPAKFQAVNQAYQILSNDEKRKRYDNGEQLNSIRSTQQQFDNEVMNALVIVFMGSIEASPSYRQVDIMQIVQHTFIKSINDSKRELLFLRESIERYEVVKSKIKHKGDGENILSRVLEATLVEKSKLEEQIKRKIEIYRASQKIAEDYDYDFDKIQYLSFTDMGIDIFPMGPPPSGFQSGSI